MHIRQGRQVVAAIVASLLTPFALCAELTLVQVAPLSGNLAASGKDMHLGISLYLEKINSAGGINGNTLRLVTADDGYKASETVKLARELIEKENPIALIGFVGTGNTEALVSEKILDQYQIALVGPRTGAVRTFNRNIFFVRASYKTEIEALIKHATTLGYTKLAVFYQDDEYGRQGLAFTKSALATRGLEIVGQAGYERNTNKVEAAAKAIAAIRPQLVIMISTTSATGDFISQLRAAGSSAVLLATSPVDFDQLSKHIGLAQARGVGIVQIMPSPYNATIALTREFNKTLSLSKIAGLRANFTTLEGYVAAKVAVAAIEHAGRNPTRTSVQQALDALKTLDLGGMDIEFSRGHHEGSRYVNISAIDRNGHLIQ